MGAFPPGECRSGYRQPVMLNGIEDAQSGIRAVAGEKNHLHSALTFGKGIDRQQLLRQWEGITWFEHILFMFDLVVLEGIQSFLKIDLVTI